jgi:hypothetical protein
MTGPQNYLTSEENTKNLTYQSVNGEYLQITDIFIDVLFINGIVWSVHSISLYKS